MIRGEMTDKQYIAYLEDKVEFYRRDYNTGLLGRKDFECDMINLFYKEKNNFYLSMHDANGLHEVNRVQGWEAGDTLLREIANQLKSKEVYQTYIIGGDEFMTVWFEDPKEIEIKNATGAYLYSGNFEDLKLMLRTLDVAVSEKKRLLKRRRDDI